MLRKLRNKFAVALWIIEMNAVVDVIMLLLLLIINKVLIKVTLNTVITGALYIICSFSSPHFRDVLIKIVLVDYIHSHRIAHLLLSN